MKYAAVIASATLAIGIVLMGSQAIAANPPPWMDLHPGQQASLFGTPGVKVPICPAPERYMKKQCVRTGRMGDQVKVVSINKELLKDRVGVEVPQKIMVQIAGPAGDSGWVVAAQLVPLLPVNSTLVLVEGDTRNNLTPIYHALDGKGAKSFAKLKTGSTLTVLQQRGTIYRVKVISGASSGAEGWIACGEACATMEGARITDWEIPEK